MKKSIISLTLVLAMVFSLFTVLRPNVYASEFGEQEPWSSTSSNAITATEYTKTSKGKVQVTVYFSNAYKGMSSENWYFVYSADGGDVETETVAIADLGMDTKYTLKKTFEQGSVVLMAAYSDEMAEKYWTEPGDFLELMEKGFSVVMPSEPTDPKETAPVVKATAKGKTFSVKDQTVSGEYYIKLVAKKDTRLYIKDFTSSTSQDYLRVVSVKSDDFYHDSQVARKGDEIFLEKGTYWLYSESNGAKISVTLNLRFHVYSSKVVWTINGKKSSTGILKIKKGKTATVKATLSPSNTDAVFAPAGFITNINNGYGQIFDEERSDDGKTITFKYKCNENNGTDAIKATVYDVGYGNGPTKDVTYVLAAGVVPGKPKLNSETCFVSYNSMGFYTSTVFDTKTQVRVEMKSGKTWKTVLDEECMTTNSYHTVKKLKPNKKYSFRIKYYTKVEDVEIASSYQKLTVKTGVKSKPSVTSVKVSNIKKHSEWVEGHWDSFGNWVKGHYRKWKTFKVTATVKKVPSGVKGLMGNGAKCAGTGKTFTFELNTDINATSYPSTASVSFQFYSDKKWGGTSKPSKVFKVKI